jgi:hypothetical protein
MKKKTKERMERRSRKRSSSAGSEKMEGVGDREEKIKKKLFSDRPKPTAACSANGRRRIRRGPIQRINNLGTGCKHLVSFTLRPLVLPRGKNPSG